MSGDEDLFSAPFTIEKVAGYWKDSEYFMFEGCAHFPQRELPSEYNALVKEYLLRKTLELSQN
jgi:pimeloyl-ACP methyl ester carboxylesterase